MLDQLADAEKHGKTRIKYDVMLSNCERFANLVTYGTPYSSQYDELGEGAKKISRVVSNLAFGSFKGKSLHESFAHALKYKKSGGIRKMPPISREEVIEKLIDFAEFMEGGKTSLREEYDTIRGRIGETFDITEVEQMDEILEALNTITMVQMVADGTEEMHGGE